MAMRIRFVGCISARLTGVFVAFALAACGGRIPTPTAGPGAFETMVAQGVAATLTADVPLPQFLPTSPPTLAVTPLPTALPAHTAGSVPTAAIPVSRFFTDARYQLADERLIAGYAVRIWRNAASASAGGFDQIATLAQTGVPLVQVEFFSEVDPLTGTDITGDGMPEAILRTYSGGAHCCFSTVVYSLGERLELRLETAASNCSGEFRDLDDDGPLEFVTCDDRFAYAYCPYAASPVVTAVLAYDPALGYVPASPAFTQLYAEPIAAHTALAEQAQPGALGEWDATTKCAVLPLVLDYLYSGQPERAWSELERLYTFPDAETFRQEIEDTVVASPLYAAP